MGTLERAIEIAKKAHHGQLDKAGEDYIGHPLRVMAMGRTADEKIVVNDCGTVGSSLQ